MIYRYDKLKQGVVKKGNLVPTDGTLSKADILKALYRIIATESKETVDDPRGLRIEAKSSTEGIERLQ
jgi:hypothetical protein